MPSKADSPTKTCTHDGCTKPLRARGLCGTHYNQAHQPNRHAKKLTPCAYCGTEIVKASGGGRVHGQVCSHECRANLVRRIKIEARTTSTDLVGPVKPRRTKPLPAPKAEIPSTGWRFHTGPCVWCNETFTAIQRGAQDFPQSCSKRCARAIQAHRRGGKKSWISKTARYAIYERDGWTCQLCLGEVDPSTPINDLWSATLDHIIPRSKQLVPDHSPNNLRLAHLWCNSVRGDETYYVAGDLLAA
jgi:5-methylcytosine-specific restriction endonuclease McrA